MAKYIDAEKLKELLDEKYKEFTEKAKKDCPLQYQYMADGLDIAEQFIDSLQQDETQVDRMLCSQVWWEEQGWIMIPPDATIEGIDSLLKQVRKKLQEQPEVELEKEIDDFLDNIEGVPRMWHSDEQIEWAKDIARHFWNKGYNARKEDDK